MKTWKTVATTAILGAMMATPAFAADTTIYYNQDTFRLNMPIENIDGRTMVAMRDLFKNMESVVDWQEATRMASLKYGDKTLYMFPDTGKVQVNGISMQLDVPPQIIHDHVYLPLRFVAETLDSTVDYTQEANGDSKIQITSNHSGVDKLLGDGKAVRVARTNTDVKNSYSQYVYDDHGYLVELQNTAGKVAAILHDANGEAKTVSELQLPTEKTGLYEYGTDSKTACYTIGKKATGNYVGVGTPINSHSYATLNCSKAVSYDVYQSTSEQDVVVFDKTTDTLRMETKTASGFALELKDKGITDADYVKTEGGTYAFLLDNHLIIMDNNANLVEELKLADELHDAKVSANGESIYVSYVSNDGSYPDLYVAEYNPEVEHVMIENVSMLYKVPYGEKFYPYNTMEEAAYFVKGNNIYALLKTDMDYFVVIYDVKEKTTHKEQLGFKEFTYTSFIDTLDDGVKLFGKDTKYFYFRIVE